MKHIKNKVGYGDGFAWLYVDTPAHPLAATKIDEEDVDRVLAHNRRWLAHDSSGGRQWGTYVVDSNRKARLHRFVLGQPAMYVDHINGDPFDNRKANLRLVTAAENSQNTRRRIDNASGFTGVYLEPRTGSWVAEITKDGRKLHLGAFPEKWLAAIAYKAAAKALGFSERHGV